MLMGPSGELLSCDGGRTGAREPHGRFPGASKAVAIYLRNFAQRAKKDFESGGLIAVAGLLDLYDVPLPRPANLPAQAWLLSDAEIFLAAIQDILTAFPAIRRPSISSGRQQSCSIRYTQTPNGTTGRSWTAPHHSQDPPLIIRTMPTPENAPGRYAV